MLAKEKYRQLNFEAAQSMMPNLKFPDNSRLFMSVGTAIAVRLPLISHPILAGE